MNYHTHTMTQTTEASLWRYARTLGLDEKYTFMSPYDSTGIFDEHHILTVVNFILVEHSVHTLLNENRIPLYTLQLTPLSLARVKRELFPYFEKEHNIYLASVEDNISELAIISVDGPKSNTQYPHRHVFSRFRPVPRIPKL